METDLLFDDEAGGTHRPELYDAGAIATPIPAVEALSDAARAHYREHGWLAVSGLLDAGEIATAAEAVADLVEDRVPGFRGRIYEASVRPCLAGMSPAERGDAVRKLFRFVADEPRLAALSEQPAMLTIIRSLLECRTPRLFQDMALLKPPRIGREKPWHQDHAFFDFSLETRFLGVWIALDPATIENGCMHVLDGGHRAGPRLHFRRRDFQICDTELLGATLRRLPARARGRAVLRRAAAARHAHQQLAAAPPGAAVPLLHGGRGRAGVGLPPARCSAPRART